MELADNQMKKLLFFLFFFGIQYSGSTQECNISEGIEKIRTLNSKGDFKGALMVAGNLQNCPHLEVENSLELLIWEYKLHRNQLKNKKAEEAIVKALSLLTRTRMQADRDFELLLLEHYALRAKKHEFDLLYKRLEPEIEALNSDQS